MQVQTTVSDELSGKHGLPDLVECVSHVLQALQVNPSPKKPALQEHCTSLVLPAEHVSDEMADGSQIVHHSHMVPPVDHQKISFDDFDASFQIARHNLMILIRML